MEQIIDDKTKLLQESAKKKIIKEVEGRFRTRVGKYARIADPANGQAFWRAVLSLPWHAPGSHIATEEKLNMIGAASVSDKDKAYLVRMLDNSQSGIRELEYLPTDKAKVREWLHMFVFWLQINQVGFGILDEIKNADRIALPPMGSFLGYVSTCRRKYFKKAFKVHQGEIKFSNDIDAQKGLQNATHRVVFR